MGEYNHDLYTKWENAEKFFPIYRISHDYLLILNGSFNMSLEQIKIAVTKYLNMGSGIDKKYIQDCLTKKNDLLKKLKLITKDDKVDINITNDEFKMIHTALLAEIPQEIFFNYNKMMEKLYELKIYYIDVKVNIKKESYSINNFFGGNTIENKYITINFYDIFGTKYSLLNECPTHTAPYYGNQPNPYPGFTKMVIYPEGVKLVNKYDIITNICNCLKYKIKHLQYLYLFFDKLYNVPIFEIAGLIKKKFIIKDDEMFVLSFSNKTKVPNNITKLNIMEAININNLPFHVEYLNIVYFNNCYPDNLPFSLKKVCFYGGIVYNDKNEEKQININELKIPFGCEIEFIRS
jgi:hypothetical protein